MDFLLVLTPLCFFEPLEDFDSETRFAPRVVDGRLLATVRELLRALAARLVAAVFFPKPSQQIS